MALLLEAATGRAQIGRGMKLPTGVIFQRKDAPLSDPDATFLTLPLRWYIRAEHTLTHLDPGDHLRCFYIQ